MKLHHYYEQFDPSKRARYWNARGGATEWEKLLIHCLMLNHGNEDKTKEQQININLIKNARKFDGFLKN